MPSVVLSKCSTKRLPKTEYYMDQSLKTASTPNPTWINKRMSLPRQRCHPIESIGKSSITPHVPPRDLYQSSKVKEYYGKLLLPHQPHKTN